MKLNPDFFAREEYRDYIIYTKLAAREKSPQFKKILEEFIVHERGDFEFWKKLAAQKEFHVGIVRILFYKFFRKIFGLTFTAKLLEGRERKTGKLYAAYVETVTDPALKKEIRDIIAHESYHERQLINQVEERRLKFVSSIILGLNDGLIELTGALVGFSFALGENKLVALAGTITGVSAALSMAASAYMQARYEPGKNPKMSGFITGLSYIAVVALLVSPFFLAEVVIALPAMAVLVFIILIIVSLYSSVLLERPFLRQLIEMFVFSVGVAIVAFLIGLFFRELVGVEL